MGEAGTARRQLWMCNTCKPVKVAQPGGSLEEVGDGRRQRFENESAAAAAVKQISVNKTSARHSEENSLDQGTASLEERAKTTEEEATCWVFRYWSQGVLCLTTLSQRSSGRSHHPAGCSLFPNEPDAPNGWAAGGGGARPHMTQEREKKRRDFSIARAGNTSSLGVASARSCRRKSKCAGVRISERRQV